MLHSAYMGRTLILLGAIILICGVLVMLGERLPIRFGRLPGDIVHRGRNVTIYFPWVTSLAVSAVLSLLFWLFTRR